MRQCYVRCQYFFLTTGRGFEKAKTLISETFKSRDLVGPLPAEAVSKNEWTIKAVIRVPRGNWPDGTLSEELKSLPPDIIVTIDPDQIV